MNRKTLIFTTAAFLVLLILFFAIPQTPLPIGTKKVDLVVTKVGFNPVFYPMENKKVPMPRGVQINLKTTGYSQAELYTLATSKRPLVGILSNVNIGKAFNHGMKFKILAPYYREIVGPDGTSMGQLVVRKRSKIFRPSNLYGKKVAIQGETDGSTIALKTVLKKKYDLDISRINFVALENEVMPELLSRGEIDAAMFDSDYIFATGFKKKYRTLVDFGRDLDELFGVVPPAKFFVVRKELYDENPTLYEKTVDYFRENYQWSLDNLETICQLESERTGEDYELLLRKKGYQSRLDKLTTADVNAFYAFYQTAKDVGAIESIPDLQDLFVVSDH